MPCHAPVFVDTLEILKDPFTGARMLLLLFASYLRRLLDCSLCGGGLSGSKTADSQPDITNWNLDLNIG
jgi:hypothetical protein